MCSILCATHPTLMCSVGVSLSFSCLDELAAPHFISLFATHCLFLLFVHLVHLPFTSNFSSFCVPTNTSKYWPSGSLVINSLSNIWRGELLSSFSLLVTQSCQPPWASSQIKWISKSNLLKPNLGGPLHRVESRLSIIKHSSQSTHIKSSSSLTLIISIIEKMIFANIIIIIKRFN